ncbi:unnamed protein product, partial [Prorocentrum cordatum]
VRDLPAVRAALGDPGGGARARPRAGRGRDRPVPHPGGRGLDSQPGERPVRAVRPAEACGISRKSGLQDGAFCYQSCSGRTASMRGTFGGEVTFVPGTRRRPTGEPFQARVQPFRLHVPEYMY